MEQLIIDVQSSKDAALIKELMKKFEGVEVNSFSNNLSSTETQRRIEAGLKDAEEGRVKPWSEVKERLVKRIKSKGK
ncbi:MAG TPA: hypothetical protein PLW44_00400 [Chitinophagales bacterium]|nr:hypothetical protein [Chitinophagales bacterium]